MTALQPTSFAAATADFATGKDTPRDLLERCLARVEEFEPAVGAFVCHDIAAARSAADRSAARWRAGRPLSPIDGMPLGIKDIIETADMPTEQGSPLFVGCHTGRDAASVAALREAGGVILGKVVRTEVASTEPRGTRNPWDSAHTGRIEQRFRRRDHPRGRSRLTSGAAKSSSTATSERFRGRQACSFPRDTRDRHLARRQPDVQTLWRLGARGKLGSSPALANEPVLPDAVVAPCARATARWRIPNFGLQNSSIGTAWSR
jgi:hypothetical protein